MGRFFFGYWHQKSIEILSFSYFTRKQAIYKIYVQSKNDARYQNLDKSNDRGPWKLKFEFMGKYLFVGLKCEHYRIIIKIPNDDYIYFPFAKTSRKTATKASFILIDIPEEVDVVLCRSCLFT